MNGRLSYFLALPNKLLLCLHDTLQSSVQFLLFGAEIYILSAFNDVRGLKKDQLSSFSFTGEMMRFFQFDAIVLCFVRNPTEMINAGVAVFACGFIEG
jgi:hypothetical protein